MNSYSNKLFAIQSFLVIVLCIDSNKKFTLQNGYFKIIEYEFLFKLKSIKVSERVSYFFPDQEFVFLLKTVTEGFADNNKENMIEFHILSIAWGKANYIIIEFIFITNFKQLKEISYFNVY